MGKKRKVIFLIYAPLEFLFLRHCTLLLRVLPLYKYKSGVFTLVLTDAGKHHKPAEPIYIAGAERPLQTGWEQQKLHHDSKIVLGKLNLILGCGNKTECCVAAACPDEDITAELHRYSV